MNRPDDLEQLWRTQPVNTAVKGEEMRKIVLKKIEAFDRMIRLRNRIESIAAMAGAVLFVVAAYFQRNSIVRLGSAIVVAAMLYIIYYIRRHGTEPADPNPDQTLAGYQRALVLKCDHQIRLSRSVKFWYLLPMYIGLLISSAGILRESAETRALTWADAIYPLIYTLVFAGVWWLNEVYAVRRLLRMRTKVVSGTGEEDGAFEKC